MSNRENLVEDNIRLVYFIISKEYHPYLHDDDIIQAGMLGLCKAAEKWDEEKGKFSTYAGRAIRNEIIQEFINRKPNSQMISLETEIGEDGVLADILVGEDGVYYVDEDFYKQLSKEEIDILNMNEMGYGTDEISELSGYDVQKVRRILRLVRLKWDKFNK